MQRACTLCVSTLFASKNVFIPKCSSYLSTSSIIFNNGGFNLFLGCVQCETIGLMIPCFSRLNLILNPQILFKFSDKKKLWVEWVGIFFTKTHNIPESLSYFTAQNITINVIYSRKLNFEQSFEAERSEWKNFFNGFLFINISSSSNFYFKKTQKLFTKIISKINITIKT